MSDYSIEAFVADCGPFADSGSEPAACVDAVLPLMRRLIDVQHQRS